MIKYNLKYRIRRMGMEYIRMQTVLNTKDNGKTTYRMDMGKRFGKTKADT